MFETNKVTLRLNYQSTLVSRGRWLLKLVFRKSQCLANGSFLAEEERGQKESS